MRVVLSPGIQAEPLSGRAAIHGLYVKFEDGVASVVDEKIIDLMLAHPGFNRDYISAEEGNKDPFVRRSIEPEHNVVNIEYGHVGKNVNPATAVSSMTPEMKKAITDLASGMAKSMTEAALKDLVPKLTADIILGLKNAAAESNKSAEVAEHEVNISNAPVTMTGTTTNSPPDSFTITSGNMTKTGTKVKGKKGAKSEEAE